MKRAKFLGAVLIFVLILLKPEQAASSAQQAMAAWYSSVAPALFPFLVLMPLLTSKEACIAYERLFARWMRPVFRLPGSAVPAVIAGMIAGSPGGAIALRRVVSNSGLTGPEARRIALAVGGVSPAYLIMGVGQQLHGSARVGAYIAIAQAIIQLLMLAILPTGDRNIEMEKQYLRDSSENRNPIMSAVESILIVCGYMVFFSVVAGVIAEMIGDNAGKLLLLILDLPSGLHALMNTHLPIKEMLQGAAIGFTGLCILPIKEMLQGAAIGFTGLCIIFQNMYVLNGLNIKLRHYIGIRIVFAMMLSLVSVIIEGGKATRMIKMIEGARISYSISMFVVAFSVLPVLFLFSNKLFLNKRKNGKV